MRLETWDGDPFLCDVCGDELDEDLAYGYNDGNELCCNACLSEDDGAVIIYTPNGDGTFDNSGGWLDG